MISRARLFVVVLLALLIGSPAPLFATGNLPVPAFGGMFLPGTGYVVSNHGGPVTYMPIGGGAVATGAALAATATTVYPAGVWRSSYSTAIYAPPLFYLPSGAACTLNSGAGDGGSQVPSADGKCWLAQMEPVVDVREWGADPSAMADSAPAFNNALAYVCSFSYPRTTGKVKVPPGTFLANSEITISCSDAGLEGDSSEASVIVTNSLTNAYVVGFVGTLSTPLTHPFLRHITVTRYSTPTPGSATKSVYWKYTAFADVEDLIAANSVTQIWAEDSTGFHLDYAQIFRNGPAANASDTYTGLRFTSTSAAVAGGFTNDQPRIHHLTSLGYPSAGTPYGAPSYGIWYDGYNLRNFLCEACDLDTTTYGVYVDGTNAVNIGDIQFLQTNIDDYGIDGYYFNNLQPNVALVSINGGLLSAGYYASPSVQTYGVYANNVWSLKVQNTVNSGTNNQGFSNASAVTNGQNIEFLGNYYRNFHNGVLLTNSAYGQFYNISDNIFFEDPTSGGGQNANAYVSLTGISNVVAHGNIMNASSTHQVADGFYDGGGNGSVAITNNVINGTGVQFPIAGFNATTDLTVPNVGFGIPYALGIGQSYTNETGSRALGTSYTNTTSNPITVTAQVGGTGQILAIINSVSINEGFIASPAQYAPPVQFVVPPQETYEITVGASGTIASWFELR